MLLLSDCRAGRERAETGACVPFRSEKRSVSMTGSAKNVLGTGTLGFELSDVIFSSFFSRFFPFPAAKNKKMQKLMIILFMRFTEAVRSKTEKKSGDLFELVGSKLFSLLCSWLKGAICNK